MRNRNDFARRFDEADLRGIFSKKVTIEQGTKALILQGGVYCGFLPSGVYTFGDLSTRLGLNLEKHTTIIIVAHRLSTIMKADRILAVSDGVIAEQGTHDELLAKNGIYKELFDTQFRTVLDMENH